MNRIHALRPPSSSRSRSRMGLLLLILALLLSGCGGGPPKSEELAEKMASRLERVKTIKGRVRLTLKDVSLLQEVWIQPPKFLRVEIEEGPPQFEGTILVLNDKEGWLYSPLLDMATVVDRSDYTPEIGAPVGSSFLETLPNDVLAAIEQASGVNVAGEEKVADREAYRVEIVLDQQAGIFPPGPLDVWLDAKFYYPLAFRTSTELEMRFEFVKFNEEIDPLTFTFFPPPGATVRRVKKDK